MYGRRTYAGSLQVFPPHPPSLNWLKGSTSSFRSAELHAAVRSMMDAPESKLDKSAVGR